MNFDREGEDVPEIVVDGVLGEKQAVKKVKKGKKNGKPVLVKKKITPGALPELEVDDLTDTAEEEEEE